jgi:ribosomal protein S27AE
MTQSNRFVGKCSKKVEDSSDTYIEELLLDICVSCGMGFMIEITKNRLQCIKCGFAMMDDENDLEMH